MPGILLVLFIAFLVLVNPDPDPALATVLIAALMLGAWVWGPRANAHEKRWRK